MKKTVLTFGLIAGAILSAMMLLTLPFHETIGFDKSELIGYTTMVAAFLFIFFGIRSYRDSVAGGTIGFGRAFRVGALITCVASACYVATWQLVYYKLAPDFAQRYGEYLIERERADGASQEEIDKVAAGAKQFQAMFENPLINIGITFVEILPLGLIVTLVSAGILQKRRGTA